MERTKQAVVRMLQELNLVSELSADYVYPKDLRDAMDDVCKRLHISDEQRYSYPPEPEVQNV